MIHSTAFWVFLCFLVICSTGEINILPSITKSNQMLTIALMLINPGKTKSQNEATHGSSFHSCGFVSSHISWFCPLSYDPTVVLVCGVPKVVIEGVFDEKKSWFINMLKRKVRLLRVKDKKSVWILRPNCCK